MRLSAVELKRLTKAVLKCNPAAYDPFAGNIYDPTQTTSQRQFQEELSNWRSQVSYAPET